MSCYQAYPDFRGTTGPQMMYPGHQQPKPYGHMQTQAPGQSGAGFYQPTGTTTPAAPPMTAPLPASLSEQSFIENILRLNLGKTGTFYMTFENNSEWNAKIFKGKIEAAGRDHIIISDPATGMRFLLLMVNLDYVTFDEPLNYSYPVR